MKRILFGSAALAALIATPALAADLAYKAPPAYYSWTGFYVGANAGAGIGVDPTTDTGVLTSSFVGGGSVPVGTNVMFDESFRHSPVGAIVGGQLGYNWQIGASYLLGLEADWQGAFQRDTATVGGCGPPPSSIGALFVVPLSANCLSDQHKLTNFGTARVRAGYVVGDWLPYVTGGIAWGTVKDNLTYGNAVSPGIFAPFGFPPTPPQFLGNAAAFSHTNTGWTIGGGVETRLWGSPWSLKVEYLYVDLGSMTDGFAVAPNPAHFVPFGAPGFISTTAFPVTSSFRFTDNIVRVGLNYHLTGGSTYAPAAARPTFKAPIQGWTGFYAGVNTGGGIARSSTTDSDVLSSPVNLAVFNPGAFPAGTTTLFNESFPHTATGALGGGQLGYNWQWRPNIVLGLEADWQGAWQRDSATVGACSSGAASAAAAFAPFDFGAGQCLSDEQKLTNFGTARARAGYLVNSNTLLYLTGGAAWGTVKDSFAYSSNLNQSIGPLAVGGPLPPPFFGTTTGFSHERGGWAIGGGAEARLYGPWSLKLEYLYVDLGSITDTFSVAPNPAFFAAVGAPGAPGVTTNTITSSFRFTDNIIRIGLNYQFGPYVVPAVTN